MCVPRSNDLAAGLTPTQWGFEKLTFPWVSSSGTLVAALRGCSLDVDMELDEAVSAVKLAFVWRRSVEGCSLLRQQSRD